MQYAKGNAHMVHYHYTCLTEIYLCIQPGRLRRFIKRVRHAIWHWEYTLLFKKGGDNHDG